MKSSQSQLDLLIVEDNDDHAELYQCLASEPSGGIRFTDRARTLAEAIDRTRRCAFDVVLLDLGLPDSIGLETLTSFLSKCDSPAVVVMTARDESELGVQAIELGAQDYMQKLETIDSAALLRSLRYSVERKERMKELERKNEDLGVFVQSASHDLRSPIGQILSVADLARANVGDSEEGSSGLQSKLNLIVETAEDTLALLDELLRFASLGATGITRELFPLQAVVEKVIQQLPAEQQSQVQSSDLPEVYGDRGLVTILIQNLVQNGFKYRSEASPEIVVSARIDEGLVVVEVADNGMGIPEDIVHRIFDFGFRGVSASQLNGQGIGLSTCRRIVKAHGGAIRVKSEVGKGSSFSAEFPQNLGQPVATN